MFSNRYRKSAKWFIITFAITLLVMFILLSFSGNTYQIFRMGLPGEIVTYSFDLATLIIVSSVVWGISLVIGYWRGYKSEISKQKTNPFPSWILEICLVLLVAILSRYRSLFLSFGVRVEGFQIGLVALAIAFGPGSAFLAGGPASFILLALLSAKSLGIIYWYFFVSLVCALEGIFIGALDRKIKIWRLVLSILGATVIGLIPYLFLYWQLNSSLTHKIGLSWSSVGLMLLNIGLGVGIGLLIRVLWTGKRMSNESIT